MPSNQKRKGPSKGKRAQQPKQNAYASARAPAEDGEVFAVVTKFFGGANVEVMCSDGKARLCVIRRKFRGRHKRSNEVTTGSLVLAGLYDWATATAGSSREKCDLLCVYSNEQTRTFSKEGRLVPALLSLLGAATGPTPGDGDDHFEFSNDIPNDAEFADLESSSDAEDTSDAEEPDAAPPVSAILSAGNQVTVDDI